MPSYSRNSRKPLQVLRLAIAGAVQGGALLAGSVAHAADQSNKFVMTAYINGAGGENLVKGRYETALAQARLGNPSDETTPTNKCVAYTMTGQLDSAKSACDAAVREARSDLMHASSSMLWRTQTLQEFLAVAYSNRAVLHWLSKDAVAAARDLAEAAALTPKADFVARNITALRSPHDSHENAVAQALLTPQS
jgi:hypothetical protein